MGRTHALVLALASAACGTTPTLDAFDQARDTDLKAIADKTADDRPAALRHRIMLDRMMLNNPTGKLYLNQDEARFKGFYLAQPVYQSMSEDYVALGDALAEGKDRSGALMAYEDAIGVADGWMYSTEAAGRARLAALHGEQRLWESLGEAPRAAAARILADAQESWLGTPDAQNAKQGYESLLAQSRAALDQQVSAENQATWAAVNQGLNQMNSSMQAVAAASSPNVTPAQRQAAVANQVAQMTPQLLQMAASTASLVIKALDIKIDPKALAVLDQITAAVPGLVDIVKQGKLDAFVGTLQGKQVVSGVVDVLGALRRGDSNDAVRKMTGDLAAIAAKAMQAAPAVVPAAAASALAPAVQGAATVQDIAARLQKLQQLLDQKLITPEDFQRERERILKEGL